MRTVTEIKFPMRVGAFLRTAVIRGLERWADAHDYPLQIDESRIWRHSAYWVRITVPTDEERAARAALSDLDARRWRQVRWARTR